MCHLEFSEIHCKKDNSFVLCMKRQHKEMCQLYRIQQAQLQGHEALFLCGKQQHFGSL